MAAISGLLNTLAREAGRQAAVPGNSEVLGGCMPDGIAVLTELRAGNRTNGLLRMSRRSPLR